VVAAQEALVTAASDLAGIGSTLGTASAAAAAPTTGVLASAADQVSEQVAALLSEHGLGYQQLSARLAAFHEQFVETLSAGASAFAAAEADAAQTLANPGAAGAAVAQSIGAGGAVSNAVGRIESLAAGSNFLGGSGLLGGITQEIGAATQAGALLLRPTGGLGVLTAARALLAPAAMTNAAVAPAASGGIGGAIEAAYLAIEPWVQYGFNLAAYAVSFLPYVGFLYPQIYFFYDLFEPIVQSGLFNTIDWLQGTITFGQGLANFGAATTASINQFINSEINWALGFLPPLPPLPPIFP
jgi:PE family